MWPADPDEFFRPSLDRPEDLDQAQYFIVIKGQLVTGGGQPWRPIERDAYRWIDVQVDSEHFLGHWQGRPAFAVEASTSGAMPEGYGLVDLYALLGKVESSLFYLAGRAKQVVDWQLNNRFCGRCGEAMKDHDEDRAKVCGDCRIINYPRLSPSMIVLIRDGERCLLARNANWREGMFSTLAGFVEVGESVEQAVHREVDEEVGLQVKNLRYLGSQSWPFPNSLMLGFHADYASGDIVCQEGEIAEAKFFHYNELPAVPPPTSISRWLIDAYLDEMGVATDASARQWER